MKVFKIGNEVHAGGVIIYLDREVTDKVHDNLLKISRISDLVLVFPKSLKKKINPKKFSFLYGAIYYGLGDTDDEAMEMWRMLDYLHELSSYHSYSIILQSDLEECGSKEFESIERLQNSILETSSFTWRHLRNEELKEIYTEEPGFFGHTSDKGMYSRYLTEDRVMFIRPFSLHTLKEDLKHGPEILATFKGSGIKRLLPSLIPVKTRINVNICDAKL